MITTQPANQSVTAGATATFTVAATGTGLSYQWQYSKDGSTWTNKSGATAASYTVTAKTSYDGMRYRCKVTNEGGSVYSDPAMLTVSAAAPVISSIKADKTDAFAGEKITWTATATGGTGALQYYFILYKDGTKLKTRSYSTTLTFSYTPTEAGSYKVKVYVKDTADNKANKISAAVTVTESTPLAIASVKANKTSANVGETITWTATASGGMETLQYYFILYKDGTKIKTQSYSTANTFSYTPTEAGTYKAEVYVKDSIGNKVSKSGGNVSIFAPSYTYYFPLHLYSYDCKVYLGKLVTDKYDSDSIWNEYGSYGSKYSATSIWNTYGDYGSAYSNESAFYKYASKPPVIVDRYGKVVGHLTTNSSFYDGFTMAQLQQLLREYNQ